MGLLSEGKPLTWEETRKYVELVKRTGALQFLANYNRLKDRPRDELKWGDEIEYTLVAVDDDKKRTQLHLIGPDILQGLQVPETEDPDNHSTKWRPEYASYMIEGTPGAVPYGGSAHHLNVVEANMTVRRKQLQEALKGTTTVPLCITAFPRIGCPSFTLPAYPLSPLPPASRSLFFPDEAVWSGHPRFITLTRNIRERRGEKVAMNVPIFKDTNTPSPFVEKFPTDIDGTGSVRAKPDHVYLDCMGFGMGCSCLQVTFQACDLPEARLLYDQLAVICPIMLSISAATPVVRGYLTDMDCRWNIVSGSVDDRTEEERGLKPLSESQFAIPTSRYDTIDCYISSHEYNDIPILCDPKIFQTLRDGGVDELLARHVAHLFIRDPVSLFEEKIHQNIEDDVDHFENIQSTNWQTMRFKPPPLNSTIGWRVEFRPLEVQLTDFENAAFVVFVVLLTRAILSFKLNILIPISKMQENMTRAQKRDAVRSEKFYFRKSVVPDDDKDDNEGAEPKGSHDHEYTEMSVDTIINGKDEFPGLIPLVRMYVNSIEMDVDTRCSVMQYLRLISKRASGELMTGARWIRHFLTSHPLYKQDSVVTEEMNYDLVKRMMEISEGTVPCLELTGKLLPKSVDN
ncbi:Glutamate--cysteine ligase catalytic subunit [Geodia barretti]|uniref:Glutamate--cysteine ligase n=2 Tax=Geodia barretti TaxID=519541 RepID=A0AA35R267_GEOBA|nr:Glutamate--cysteine ligase catalytic subunit [Geodia barretti]